MGVELTLVVTMGTVISVAVTNCPPPCGEMLNLDTGILLGAGNVQAYMLGIT